MVWAATAVVSCEDNQARLALRDAIYSYEIDRVEAMLAEPEVADIRCLYSPFRALRPKTAEFVTHWLDRHPESPSAMAAKALILLEFSKTMRGTRQASATYQGALIEAREMREMARALALEADRLRPGFAPAGDVMAYLAEVDARGEIAVLPGDATIMSIDEARAALEHAPADPRLIGILQERATPEEALDYAARLLVAAPYDPAHWHAHLAATKAQRPMSYAEAEPYRVNQVVFANHAPRALKSYILEKLVAFEGAASGIEDREAEVICPTVRAFRLHRHVCSFARDSGCEMPLDRVERLAEVVGGAMATGACFDERNLPVRALAFQPSNVPSLEY